MIKEIQTYHNPVLLKESILGLNISTNSKVVDLTFGGGGHSKTILKQLDSCGHLFAFDQDKDALKNSLDAQNFTLIDANFRYVKNFLEFENVLPVDAILADLGVSSYQFDTEKRGFSIRYDDALLDMRMDVRNSKTAGEVLNTYEEAQLADVFYYYGEIRNARKLARNIVNYCKENTIQTTSDFKIAANSCIEKSHQNKYMAKVFQALRIEVNEELEALKEMLQQSLDCLRPGGRMVVISYHSLEDRLVKNFFKSGNFKGEIEKDFYGNPLVPWKIISKKAIIPSDDEQKINPRSRSAKLRIAEKI